MADSIDSTRVDACKSDDFIVPEIFPEYLRPNKSQDLRHACVAAGIPIDFVYRVIGSLDEHAGRRELGDLVAAIGDADRPLSVIEMMIDHDLVRFVPDHPFDAALPVERIT